MGSAGSGRSGFTIRDLVVAVSCFLVAGSLLISLTGATRDLSQVQVCANNLRQLYTGLAMYVSQYNSYPPNSPYPSYTGGLGRGGFDPSIGWILTYGLGMQPPGCPGCPWYVLNEDELPDVLVCPAANRQNLFPLNPEIDSNSLESFMYQYAAFYQTSGTCRSACPVKKAPTGTTPGEGGRNLPVPDPTSAITARNMDNANNGVPYVWVFQHNPATLPDDPSGSTTEMSCWIQAVHPSEIDQPARVFYLADSRDYRPRPKGQPGDTPRAAMYSGWVGGSGNTLFMSSRHYGYGNVMYLDGTVTRDGQTHEVQWNLGYDPLTGQANSSQWRVATFDTDVRLANIRRQMPIMPVFRVVGWEAFFDANGMKAR